MSRASAGSERGRRGGPASLTGGADPAGQGLVDEVRAEIERRLALLAPAREEAGRLRRALAALEGDVPTDDGGPARAARGARAALLLQAVRDRPGITQRELAEAIGMTPAAVYGPVRRAVLKGQVVKRDGALYPVDGASA